MHSNSAEPLLPDSKVRSRERADPFPAALCLISPIVLPVAEAPCYFLLILLFQLGSPAGTHRNPDPVFAARLGLTGSLFFFLVWSGVLKPPSARSICLHMSSWFMNVVVPFFSFFLLQAVICCFVIVNILRGNNTRLVSSSVSRSFSPKETDVGDVCQDPAENSLLRNWTKTWHDARHCCWISWPEKNNNAHLLLV